MVFSFLIFRNETVYLFTVPSSHPFANVFVIVSNEQETTHHYKRGRIAIQGIMTSKNIGSDKYVQFVPT